MGREPQPSISASRRAAIERTLRQAQQTPDAYEGEDSWVAAYRKDVSYLLNEIENCDGALRGR